MTLLSLLVCVCIGADATPSLDAPAPTNPPPGAGAVVFHPHVDWRPVAGAQAYRVQIARDAAFEDSVDDDAVHAVVQWYVTEKRLPPGSYWWRVRAERDDGTVGPWSASRRFEIVEPAETFHVAPGTGMEELRRIGRAAAEADAARIVFEPKDYYLDPGFERAVFEWENADDIIIEGNGARIHIMDPSAQLVNMLRCRRMLLGGYTFFHEPCPLAYAELLQADAERGVIDVQVLSGFQGVNYPREVNQFFLYALDPEDPRRLHPERPGHTFLVPGATEDLGDGRRRYTVREEAEKPGLRQFEPGDKLIVAYRRWPRNWVHQCEDVTFFDLRGGYSEGSLFMGGGNVDMKFLHHRNPSFEGVFPSTGAWVTGNNRRGPWVEDCHWEAMSDDGPNFTGNAYLIEAVLGPDRFRLDTGPIWQHDVWRAGDAVMFWDPATGLPVAETTVVEAEEAPDGSPIVQVTPAPQNLRPGNDLQTSTQVYNLTTQNHQLVLRGNTLRGGRRFGFFVKAMNALIEGNTFTGQASSALFFEGEPSGWEGLMCRNVVVQNNHIEDCGSNAWSVSVHRANIQVNLWRCNPVMAETPWIGHRGFLIRRNTIVDREGIGIGVDNAEDVAIVSNVISNGDKHSFKYGDARDNAAIRIFERTRDVRLEGNEIPDARPGYEPVMRAPASKGN